MRSAVQSDSEELDQGVPEIRRNSYSNVTVTVIEIEWKRTSVTTGADGPKCGSEGQDTAAALISTVLKCLLLPKLYINPSPSPGVTLKN